MTHKNPNISFFCPAYFDEKNLPRLIPEAVATFRFLADRYEIIIIEDGSPDLTGQVAEDLKNKFPHIEVFHHPKNMGYGATIRDGFDKARKYEWVCTTDGDRQYDISELKEFVKYLDEYDAIVGYRKVRELSRYRLMQTFIYNILIRLLYGLKLRDINCSFKCVRRSLLNNIELKSDSAFIDAELMIKLYQVGGRIKEVPVTHFPRLFGEASGAKPQVVLNTLKEMFKFYFAKSL